MESYAGDIVTASEYEGAEEFDPFENTEENIEIVPDSPPETKWYHGRLDRKEAENRLKKVGLPGSYLIRERDKKPGVYVLSFLNESIDHFQITAMCGAYYIGGREFNSLSVLIGYYTGWSDLLKNKRLVHPVPPPEPVFDRKLVKSIVRYMRNPDTDELSFVEGEVFLVHNDMGDGWLWVTSTLTKKSGIINQDLVRESKDDDDPVLQFAWFHPNMPKAEMATKLANGGPGSWLVRKSEGTPGDYTLYFLCKSLIQRFKIQKRSAGLYFMGGRNFNSVAEVVERYKTENLVEGYHLEQPVLRDPPDTASISSDLSDSFNSHTINKVKHSNGSNFFSNRKDNIVLKGHLHKKSEKTKKWKKMFFVLNETEQQLFYFDNERRSKPKGLINLNTTSLYPVHDSLFERPNVFLLVSRELNQTSMLYLCSDNTDTMQEWAQKLRMHCSLPQQHHNDNKKSKATPSLTELRSLHIKICDVKFTSTKHLHSHPYCIISLNDAKVARTQIINNEKVWDEDFLIEDIPSDVDCFKISIYNKEKMSKDKELDRIEFKIDKLEPDNEVGNWYVGSECRLRVAHCFRHEVIMPVSQYSTLKALIMDKKMELVVLLEDLCSKNVQDKNLLATSLLNLYRHQGQEISLIKKFIERDIDREENKENLFRSNSFGTSLMDAYMNMVASNFLHKATQSTINKTLKISADTPNSAEADKSLIKDLFSELLNDITKSYDAIPPVLKHIFYCLRSRASLKWDDQQTKIRVVSAFLFLRFIGPALTKPRSHNLITENPSPLSLRMLKSLTNWLIKLSNLTEFKEADMKCYNPVLQELRPKIIKFITRVSDESTEPDGFGPSSAEICRCLASIHRLCFSKKHILEAKDCQLNQMMKKRLLEVTVELSSKEDSMKENKTHL